MNRSDPTGFRARQVLADLGRVQAAVAPDAAAGAAARILAASITGSAVADADWSLARQGRGFREQPAPIRAALLNGVEHLRALGKLRETAPLSPDDLTTNSQDEVEAELIRLARTMTQGDIEHIARADFGADLARNRAALLALLQDERMSLPLPTVVEMVASAPGQPGHMPCLALVLLQALRDGDAEGRAALRLEMQYADIARLHPTARDGLLAGFRHLYESNRAWSPDLPLIFTLPWTRTA
ncbi:MAG: hypothetical protein ACLGIE_16280 [Alphaproteobacteria bacterium]